MLESAYRLSKKEQECEELEEEVDSYFSEEQRLVQHFQNTILNYLPSNNLPPIETTITTTSSTSPNEASQKLQISEKFQPKVLEILKSRNKESEIGRVMGTILQHCDLQLLQQMCSNLILLNSQVDGALQHLIQQDRMSDQ